MAQPAKKVPNTFAADTAKYLQRLDSLTQLAQQQQNQLNINQQSTQLLQSNLSQTHTNGNTHPNNHIDDESKRNNDVTEMAHKMSGIKLKNTGIEDATQGVVTVHHHNRQLPNYCHSTQYADFSSMADILKQHLLDACDRLNFQYPSKIQAEAIPRCLTANNGFYPNLIGQAHHGSGKTATFTLIMLQRIDETRTKLQGLVVLHSRELAIQTYNVFIALGQFVGGLKVVLAIKGENIANQPWTSQICVGNPGSIIGKIFNAQKRSKIGIKGFLSDFKILVVDEADEFLKTESQKKKRRGTASKKNNGFGSLFDQLKMITTDITSNVSRCQTLLFSATYPASVKHLAHEIAPDSVIIKVAQKQVQLDNICIFKILCADEVDKFNTLLRVMSLANIGQMIIFVNTIKKAKQLIDGLEAKELGIACSALYGKGMDIKLRDLTMDQFRKNQTQCLVASNVIARGIDVPAVGLVVNFEVPINSNMNISNGKHELTFDSETFMHRVGRTGRFGAKGVCINLIARNDNIANDRLDNIQKEYALNIQPIDNSAKEIKEKIRTWLAQS